MRDEISENSSRCGWQLWTNSSLSVRNSRQRKQSAKLSISCAIESRFYWPINQFFFIQNMFIMRRRYFLLPLTAVAAIICTNRAQLINRFYWKSFSGKLKNKMFFSSSSNWDQRKQTYRSTSWKSNCVQMFVLFFLFIRLCWWPRPDKSCWMLTDNKTSRNRFYLINLHAPQAHRRRALLKSIRSRLLRRWSPVSERGSRKMKERKKNRNARFNKNETWKKILHGEKKNLNKTDRIAAVRNINRNFINFAHYLNK